MNNSNVTNMDCRQNNCRFLLNYLINCLHGMRFRKPHAVQQAAHDSFVSGCALTLMVCMLSGCMAPAVMPDANQINRISRLLVVPMEAPPLEVIPDPVKTRVPVLTQYYYETVPAGLLMSDMIYRNRGGILIAGKVAVDDSVQETVSRHAPVGWDPITAQEPSASLKENWDSTSMLAGQAVSLLNKEPIKVIFSKNHRRLDLPEPANIDNWRQAIRRWYALDRTPMTDHHADAGTVDAILEIGVGAYRIFENQTSLQLLLKLIEPGTGRVIGRTRLQDFSAEDSALALLGHEGEKFKSLITRMGDRLLKDGLKQFGLIGAIHNGGGKPDQVAVNGLVQ